MITTFTKRIPVESFFQPEFFFNRIYSAGGIRFHISVLDKQGHYFHFAMVEKSGQWKIIDAPQPPEWIKNIEQQLGMAINQGVLS